MSIESNIVLGANVYLDGASQLGKVEEANLGEVKFKTIEQSALGMFGKRKAVVGVEAIEVTFKWNSFYKDALAKVGDPFKDIALQLRASGQKMSDGGQSNDFASTVHIRGQFVGYPIGNYKQHDPVEAPSTMAANYVKHEVEGVTVLEIDVDNNIFTVNGEDKLNQYRTNIGG